MNDPGLVDIKAAFSCRSGMVLSGNQYKGM
jgi:hypothetical protein